MNAEQAVSAGLLSVCWMDSCSEAVDPGDTLGLCRAHVDRLRARGGTPPRRAGASEEAVSEIRAVSSAPAASGAR